MISRASVSAVVDRAEQDYLDCWELLCRMKDASSCLTAQELLSFQPKLAEALFRLSSMYRSLHQEKRHFVGKKQSLDTNWFPKRLKLIKQYQDIISTVIAIGKALGDSFAWFFYHREAAHLVRHREHERIYHAPPGIGGRGELEFIKRVQVIGGCFVVYHGITDMLRLGDVSLIELSNFKLSAIAELKTERVAPGELCISLAVIGNDKKLQRRLDEQAQDVQPTNDHRTAPAFSDYLERTLKKQLKKIGDSFRPTRPGAELSAEMMSNATAIEALFKSENKQASCKIGNSQVLVRLPVYGKSLMTRTREEPRISPSELDIIDLTKQILVERREDNAFYLANIHSPSAEDNSFPGFMPLFWFPLSTRLVEELLFFRSRIISIYNPGPLVQGMRALGFDVKVSGKTYIATRPVCGGTMTLEGISYFMAMVARQFFSEESVLDILRQTIATAEEQGIREGTRIQLQIMQLLPPQSMLSTEVPTETPP
jgi:hypothetical protein